MVYSTYLGGSTNETITEIGGASIAVDNTGSAYVTGGSDSLDFPTYQAQQATLAGAGPDAVVAKLNPAGSALVYSTYLGGSDYDDAAGIAVDQVGNAYVTGVTASTDFTTTTSAFQSAISGSFDAFAAKFNPAGSALVYSTYLGGSGDETGLGIALDPAGNAYLSGNTTSTDFPTRNPVQPTLGGSGPNNLPDAYLAKLDAAGSALVYATYLGGSGWEWGSNIAVDTTGNAVVTGDSGSPDFPTKSPLMPVPQGDVMDAFVTQLDATGTALVFSSHLGVTGPGDTSGRGVGLDAAGNIYVAGLTGAGFPTTGGALQPDFGGLNDGFIVKIAAGTAASVDAPLWLVALGDVIGDGTQAVAAVFEDVAAQTVTGVVRNAADGTLIQTIAFGSTYAPLDAVMVPDLDGNGAPELALLRFTADAQVQVEVRDTRTGERRTALTFAAAFLPKRLAVVPDLNGNGAVELAVLGIHSSSGAVAAEIKDARTGVRLRQVYFDKTYQPLDFAAVADANGNGAAELAVLGIKSGSQSKVELRDTQSGQLVKNLWSPKIFTPIALAAIPDTNGNGTPEIAVLGRNTSMNVEVRTLDAGTAAQLGIAYYSRAFTPLQLAALPDLNGNGVPELAVLSRNTAGLLKTELRDAVTGTQVRNVWFDTLTPRDLAVLPDLNGNGRPEIAVLGIPSTGAAQVLIKDAGTQAQISRLDF
ncbi:SBBP repeat-containing protein [uncultured Lamprocystis sp.]|uniref:SBBP repeat-containing protein n=1 Tax=uncultured Lamprocystis sp. TaxID=543132 RepID=UPI0025DC7922|nr:SBBP repeat-containing protein [uncultured Lamprocystis sp.]